jgi:hypothetical protein
MRMGEVTPFNKGGGGPHDPSHDRWLRRQALQLAAQLPDDPADARRIAELMLVLLKVFIDTQI